MMIKSIKKMVDRIGKINKKETTGQIDKATIPAKDKSPDDLEIFKP